MSNLSYSPAPYSPAHRSAHRSAQYWNLWCINPGDNRLRYQRKSIALAKIFLKQQLPTHKTAPVSPESSHIAVQEGLLQQFKSLNQAAIAKPAEIQTQAYAGLCLRCYVSTPILRACQKIDSLFSGNKRFSYQDLLPFVLNDDGQTLVVIDDDQLQHTVGEAGELSPSAFEVFSVDVLKTYRCDGAASPVENRASSMSTNSMSLDNWAYLRTKQQPELKRFLAEYGFQPFSDWALLNRIQVHQLERLSNREQAIAAAFHRVYRRDRRIQKQVSRCPDPTPAQLVEMNQVLDPSGMAFGTIAELLKALKGISQQLRTFDIWQAREPLEIRDVETGEYALRVDLPAETTDELDIEEREFLDFLQQQLTIALTRAIEQAVKSKIAKLKKSKRYSPFASVYSKGLQRYYQEGLSLKDIGVQLGMNNWDQTRRILNPGDLLSQVRQLTAQQLLAPILKAAQAKGLTATPADPTYLRTLMEQIETFLDSKLFAEAASEIKAGKSRSLDSDYAKALLHYLNSSLSTTV